MSNFGDKPFGLNDIKLTDILGTTQVDLPAAQTLTFKERVQSDELKGDDETVAVVAGANGVEWSLGNGGISLEAYALMTGRTVTDAGTTPHRTKTLAGSSPKNFPYFKIFGKSLGDGEDDIHCKIGKAKLTSAMEGSFENGKFFVTKCTGIGVPDESGNAYEFVQNETAVPLDTEVSSGS